MKLILEKRLIFSGFFLLAIVLSNCSRPVRIEAELFCDFENIDLKTNTAATSHYYIPVKIHHAVICKRMAKSGHQCLALVPGHKKGLSFQLPQPFSDEIYEIVINHLSAKDSVRFSLNTEEPRNKIEIKQLTLPPDSSGWAKTIIKFTIPPHISRKNIAVNIMVPGNDTVFADDLHVYNHSFKTYPKYPHDQTLYIYIDSLGINKLNEQRKNIFLYGINENKTSDYVQTILFFKGLATHGRLRLRGQNIDHVRSGKWSMRIDLGKQAWNQMPEFSIYNPRLREYTDEIFVHWWLKNEGLLATRMGLVPVSINSKSIGVMVWEEDFDTEFLTLNQRPSGLIFKPNDQILQYYKEHHNKQKDKSLLFISAEADFFSERKLAGMPDFSMQCQNARNLFYQFKNQLQPAGEIFDLKQLANFIAIIDITKSWHLLQWNNLRFYYNPVCEKLELIAHDCSPGTVSLPGNQLIIASAADSAIKIFGHSCWFVSDPEFQKYYISYLKRYANVNYFDSLMKAYKDELALQTALLKHEKTDFTPGINQIKTNALAIAGNLKTITAKLSHSTKPLPAKEEYDYLPIPEMYRYFIKVYHEQIINGRRNIFIRNYLPATIVFDGSGKTEMMQDNLKSRKLFIPANGSVMTYDIDLSDTMYYFHEKNSEFAFSVKGLKYSSPKNYSNIRSILNNFNYLSSLIHSRIDTVYVPEKWIIDQIVYIPGGYIVAARPGTQIILNNRAFIFSHSPLCFTGKPSEHITITTTGQPGGGIVAAGKSNYLEFVDFYTVGNPEYGSWSLPGVLNICDGNIKMKDCEMQSANADGLLYLLHSKAVLNRCKFTKTNMFAIKADFSDLTAVFQIFNLENANSIILKNSSASIDTSNFQGNQMAIDADKNSNIKIGFCAFLNCNKAVNASNGSLVTIANSTFRECYNVLYSGSNLPDYKPSIIIINKSKFTGNHTEYIITDESFINKDGTIIRSNEKKRKL